MHGENDAVLTLGERGSAKAWQSAAMGRQCDAKVARRDATQDPSAMVAHVRGAQTVTRACFALAARVHLPEHACLSQTVTLGSLKPASRIW